MQSETSSVLGHLVEVTGDYFVANLSTDLEGLSTDKMIGMDKVRIGQVLSLIHISEPTRLNSTSRMPSSA